MIDRQILENIKAGNIEYLDELQQHFGRKIFNYFLKSTLHQADSEDLLQEFYERVWKYRKTFKSGYSVENWLFKIARNMLMRYYQKTKINHKTYDLKDVIWNMFEEKDEQDRKDKILFRAMAKLTPEKRELLVLSKFEKIQYSDIADLKQTTISNIKVQVHRIIKELKQHYQSIDHA